MALLRKGAGSQTRSNWPPAGKFAISHFVNSIREAQSCRLDIGPRQCEHTRVDFDAGDALGNRFAAAIDSHAVPLPTSKKRPSPLRRSLNPASWDAKVAMASTTTAESPSHRTTPRAVGTQCYIISDMGTSICATVALITRLCNLPVAERPTMEAKHVSRSLALDCSSGHRGRRRGCEVCRHFGAGDHADPHEGQYVVAVRGTCPDLGAR